MASSYRRYNDLASTPAEKRREEMVQKQMLEQQELIKKQQSMLEEQEKKLKLQQQQIARSSRIAQQAAQARAQLTQQQNKSKYEMKPSEKKFAGAVKVKTKEQKHKAIWANEICVFKISAPWCGPCQKIAPIYDQIAKSVNVPGKIMLFSEELDDKLSADVQGVPAFDYYFRGKKQHRQMGADIEQVKKNINMMTSQTQSISNGVQAKLQPATPHPADGMQSKNRNSGQGMYPPSALRM